MRVGGDFFFDPSPSEPSVDLLLVAGGVGINPLYSILLHTTDLLRLNRASGSRNYNIGSTHLCYSAKTSQELLFKVWSHIMFGPFVKMEHFHMYVWKSLLCFKNTKKNLSLSHPNLFFSELHHWNMQGVSWQILLQPPHHTTGRRSRPTPPGICQK